MSDKPPKKGRPLPSKQELEEKNRAKHERWLDAARTSPPDSYDKSSLSEPTAKKPKPQWGEESTGHREHELFPDDKIRELAEICVRHREVDNAAIDELRELLRDESSIAQVARYQADDKTDPKDQRVALVDIEKRVSALLAKLDLLDNNSRRSLGRYYPQDPLEHEGDPPTSGLYALRRDYEHLHRLRRGLRNAVAGVGGEVRRGRPAASVELAVVCRAFITVYMAYTGHRFTYDYRPRAKGLAAFPSVSAQFVAKAAWAVFRDATEANLATAMRDLGAPEDEPPETE